MELSPPYYSTTVVRGDSITVAPCILILRGALAYYPIPYNLNRDLITLKKPLNRNFDLIILIQPYKLNGPF